MRRLACFVVASGLVVAGVYVLVSQFMYADVLYGKVFAGCGMSIAVGGYWLWVDFIAPLLGRQPDA